MGTSDVLKVFKTFGEELAFGRERSLETHVLVILKGNVLLEESVFLKGGGGERFFWRGTNF